MTTIMSKLMVLLIAKILMYKFVVADDFPDPVLYLPLNKHYGTRDISKNRLTTTATGVTLAAGPDGEAGGSYYFAGSSSSYVEIPHNAKTDTRYSITMSALVYTEASVGPIVHYHTAAAKAAMYLYIIAPAIVFVCPARRNIPPIGEPALQSVLSPSTGWYHLAYTYDTLTGIQTLYVNGAEVQSMKIGSFEIATQFKIKVGGQKHSDSRLFKGRITCLQIYDKALNADQIVTAKAFCDNTGFPEPVLFLPLNKEYGTRDISKNKLTTTAVGVTLDSGPDGQADGSYYFAGSASSYIDVTKHDKTDTRYSITMSAWIYIQNVAGPVLLYATEASAWASHVYIVASPKFYCAVGRRSDKLTPGALMSDVVSPSTGWYYFAYTYDYDTGIQKLFINGAEVTSSSIGSMELATNYKIKVGGQKIGDARLFKGKISCLQIYDTALSLKEILAAQKYCRRNELYTSCFNYQTTNESLRSLHYKISGQPSDVHALSRAHWYRMSEKRILSSCLKRGSCGTQFPGWLNGQYPSREDGIKKMEICYRSGSNCCASKGSVFVRQCYGYHVFKFDDFPAQGRFCTEQDPPGNDVMFMSTNERRLSGHVLHNVTDVKDVSQCIAYCLSVGNNCKSVNFINEGNGKCQLNKATGSDSSLIEDSQSTYYDKL